MKQLFDTHALKTAIRLFAVIGALYVIFNLFS